MGGNVDPRDRKKVLLFVAGYVVTIATLLLGILVATDIHDRGRTFADLLTDPAAGPHPAGARLVDASQSDCAFRSPCRNTYRLYWGSPLAPVEALDQAVAELSALGYAEVEATAPGECRRWPGRRQLRRGAVTARLHAHPTPYPIGRTKAVNGIGEASALVVELDNFSTQDEAALRAEGKCRP